MITVLGDSFILGCDSTNDIECSTKESTLSNVTLSTFKISKYLVTFDQYDDFCYEVGKKKADDNGWGRTQNPVINVDWYDAKQYCDWLSKKNNKTYRLPTEAEWEFAAKGGVLKEGFKYSGSNTLLDVACRDGYISGHTEPVGSKLPNGLGLYDMSGNVFEWCLDYYNPYTSEDKTDPLSTTVSSEVVCRGGCCFHEDIACRVDVRHMSPPNTKSPNLGFRVVEEIT